MISAEQAARLLQRISHIDGRQVRPGESAEWERLLRDYTDEELNVALDKVALQPRNERPSRIEPRDLVAIARLDRKEWMRVNGRNWGAVRPWDGYVIKPTQVDILEMEAKRGAAR